jgi:hypothetical protein
MSFKKLNMRKKVNEKRKVGREERRTTSFPSCFTLFTENNNSIGVGGGRVERKQVQERK